MSKKQNTREAIINAAKYLFQVQGYHATGINQIIQESGAPKGSLYYHFPKGKEEIAIAAIESVRASVHQDIMQWLYAYDNPVEAMQAQMNHIASKVLDDKQIEFRMGLIASESVNISDEIREACEKTYDDWMAVNAHYLIEKGYSRERAEQIANLINILIEGAMTMSITYQNSSFFKMLVNRIPKIFENT